MNALPTTTSVANHNGPQPRLQGLCMAQSAAVGQMPIGAMDGHSGGVDSGNEALARSCEDACLKLETIVDEFERMGWDRHASYVQTMASHMMIYTHQIRGRENK